MAAYKQAVYAKQVQDTHTQIEGFCLTLESKVPTWFQTLGLESKVSLEWLEKDFIAAFSKMGIKHNAVAQILLFQQHEHETVRDSIKKLKQYIVHCLDDEKASQARLISSFLEGLRNWMLYAHLYTCQHRTFNDCCINTMDFDDNFDASSQENNRETRQTSHFDSSSNRDSYPKKIVEIVLRQLGQTYKPPY